MISRSVICYVLQRNIASTMNIGFDYVFVSVGKVNLSAELLYVVMVKTHWSKVGVRSYKKGPKVVRRKQKVGNPCFMSCSSILKSTISPSTISSF